MEQKNETRKRQDERDPVNALLEGLQVRNRQTFRNMTVYALFHPGKKRTSYLTLSQAFDKGVLEVTEVDTAGSVPELKVINKGKKRVLLLDGEELAGAKQNRILNTSILLKKESGQIIPVSCTEHGRWDRTTTGFRDSGYLASHTIRSKKSRSVTHSLAYKKSYRSDQGEVWDNVEHLLHSSGSGSQTRAMRDAYEYRKGELQRYLHAFSCEKGQHGLIILIDGEVAGMEYISSPEAFCGVFSKLIGSYAFEAMLRDMEKKMQDEGKHGETTEEPQGVELKEFEEMERFRDLLLQARKTKFKSPGHGWDHRLVAGLGTSVNGNALVYRDEVIHLVAFGDHDE